MKYSTPTGFSKMISGMRNFREFYEFADPSSVVLYNEVVVTSLFF